MSRILSISVTERGRELASRLGFEHVHGDAGGAIRSHWDRVDALVLFIAVGASVRLVAPLVGSKSDDPAVVCVDESGRYAISLLGGHARAANELARRVAATLGGEAVITTATDATFTPALDLIPGFAASGDVARVSAAILDGRRPRLENRLGWPLPRSLLSLCEAPESGDTSGSDSGERVVVTDEVVPDTDGVVVLHPPSLVAGVGSSTGAPPEELRELLIATLSQARLAGASVGEVATIDRRLSEPAVLALGLPVRSFSAADLALAPVPTPSEIVAAAVGTPSVAEAAALLAAGEGAALTVAKQKSSSTTIAIARRSLPRGRIAIVGLGPGGRSHRTPAAEQAVLDSDVVIGYAPYVEQCADLLRPYHSVERAPIGAEVQRAENALRGALGGRQVAVVSSGDPGIYAMASIVLEVAAAQGKAGAFDLSVVPGVTASLASAAALGAPLGHDHAVISLSDLLTPWDVIRARLVAAAEGDFAVVLYNPRSGARDWQLGEAAQILLEHRSPLTPVGVVTDAARAGEVVRLTTLGALGAELVGMTTCVIVGCSSTAVLGPWMVTPRGYRRPES